MTKTDARKAIKLLEADGYRDGEVIKYENSWRVYVTANEGTRLHFDAMERVTDRIADNAFAKANPW